MPSAEPFKLSFPLPPTTNDITGKIAADRFAVVADTGIADRVAIIVADDVGAVGLYTDDAIDVFYAERPAIGVGPLTGQRFNISAPDAPANPVGVASGSKLNVLPVPFLSQMTFLGAIRVRVVGAAFHGGRLPLPTSRELPELRGSTRTLVFPFKRDTRYT